MAGFSSSVGIFDNLIIQQEKLLEITLSYWIKKCNFDNMISR